MKFRLDRLSFTIPVLIIAGMFYCMWSYYAEGASRLKETAEVWLGASVVAILLSLGLRRISQVKK
jgi:hypothetical protein